MTPRSRSSGFALASALVGVVLVSAFAALALLAATARLRLAGDLRIAVEADLRVASLLAERRVLGDSLLAALSDGGALDFGIRDADGWRERSWAERRGLLVRLSAEVTLQPGAGAVIGARRATLLLGVVTADTLRVSGYRSRY